MKNGSALIVQPSQVIETDLVAVAYDGEGVKRVGRDGRVEQ
jgi:hypothetical protein